MPIYAYRCTTCGHAKDVLQKMSDPLLTVCPSCGAATFAKQVTAAGFQLKGSGWYVTDFKGDTSSKPTDKTEGGEPAKADVAAPAAAPAAKSDTGTNAAPAPAPAPASAAPPAAGAK